MVKNWISRWRCMPGSWSQIDLDICWDVGGWQSWRLRCQSGHLFFGFHLYARGAQRYIDLFTLCGRNMSKHHYPLPYHMSSTSVHILGVPEIEVSPKCLVYHGTSYWNGWWMGYPHFRKPPWKSHRVPPPSSFSWRSFREYSGPWLFGSKCEEAGSPRSASPMEAWDSKFAANVYD